MFKLKKAAPPPPFSFSTKQIHLHIRTADKQTLSPFPTDTDPVSEPEFLNFWGAQESIS